MNISSSAPAGNYPITVTATGGGVSRSTSFTLTITGTVAPSFDFTLNHTGNKSVEAGAAVTNTITAAMTSGTSQAVSFSVSGLPSGAIASLSSGSCNPSCSTVLTINSSGSTPAGDFPITIAATGGNVTRTTAFILSVGLTVATPTVSPNGGSFTGSVSVTIQTTTAGASVFYTTDNSTPTQASIPYSSAITLTDSAVVKAKAFKDGYNSSALASASFAISTTTGGTVYYVATTGSDSNPGTDAQPFRTINKGVGMLKPGDTLYVKQGLYTEWLQDPPSGVSWTKPVRIAAYPGHTVILKPNSAAIDVVYFSEGSNRSYIIFDGLILDAVNVLAHGFEIRADDNPNASHHIRVQNVEIKNARGNGVAVGKRSSDNEFINCKVHDNGTDLFAHGFYMNASRSVVDGCEIYNHQGWGLHLYSEAHANITVRNSTIYNNGEGGLLIYNATGDLAYNNIIRANKGWGGIKIEYGTNVKIYNNTVYGNDGSGINIKDSTNTVAQNNIAYKNNIMAIQNNGIGSLLTNNLTNDPRFVDGANGNFKLQSGSPAIDAGITVNDVLADFEGTPRPQGARHDVGAFESLQ
jgi:parallel beta-helix repeat protein/VCBS repeat-containing protein